MKTKKEMYNRALVTYQDLLNRGTSKGMTTEITGPKHSGKSLLALQFACSYLGLGRKVAWFSSYESYRLCFDRELNDDCNFTNVHVKSYFDILDFLASSDEYDLVVFDDLSVINFEEYSCYCVENTSIGDDNELSVQWPYTPTVEYAVIDIMKNAASRKYAAIVITNRTKAHKKARRRELYHSYGDEDLVPNLEVSIKMRELKSKPSYATSEPIDAYISIKRIKFLHHTISYKMQNKLKTGSSFPGLHEEL